jgi:hypothetical protein
MNTEPKVTFRIIRRCNFDCPGCSTFSTMHRKGIMRMSDFQAAVNILRDYEFCGVLNISGGEPTLHRGLPVMIRYASSNLPAARIALFTNGDWVGRPGWKQRLKRLAVGPNVLIRFSLDVQHAQGAILAACQSINAANLKRVEQERIDKAKLFKEACIEFGFHFDYAFKGSYTNARRYMRELGDVPVYLIRLRKNPDRRPKKWGFFAVDVEEDGGILVYPTLGHIPVNEPLGGMDALPIALEINRKAMQ